MESCVRRVRSALASLPTTYAVGADLDRDEIYVSYDARAGTAAAASEPMIEAIKNAGFDPWLKKAGWPEPAPDAIVVPASR